MAGHDFWKDVARDGYASPSATDQRHARGRPEATAAPGATFVFTTDALPWGRFGPVTFGAGEAGAVVVDLAMRPETAGALARDLHRAIEDVRRARTTSYRQ
ncbi:MAG: hypothetical protein U0169_22550 [Polyangiaceae bacterium]